MRANSTSPIPRKTFKPAEIEMARQLVDALTGEFDASRYKDEYREALLQVIERKVAGQPVEAPAPAPEASKLTDLMAVLEASVAAARGEKDEAAGKPAAEEPVSVEKARKTRARKTKAADTKSRPSKAEPASKRASKSSSTTRKRKSA